MKESGDVVEHERGENLVRGRYARKELECKAQSIRQGTAMTIAMMRSGRASRRHEANSRGADSTHVELTLTADVQSHPKGESCTEAVNSIGVA